MGRNKEEKGKGQRAGRCSKTWLLLLSLSAEGDVTYYFAWNIKN